MNKAKKRFIEKLRKKNKEDIIQLVVSVLEENYAMEQEIKRQKTITFSHQVVIRSILNSIHPIEFEFEEEERNDTTQQSKESLRSYA
ncbi:MAG: hypothetical protein WC525_03600 [Candidatus Thermoplasmatota archaeon]